MAKSKIHAMHNQSRKWHRNSIKEPRSQRYDPLEGVDPKFPRNMHHEGYQGSCAAQRVRPKFPRGFNHKCNRLAYIAHAKLGRCAHACITAGLRLCQRGPRARLKLWSRLCFWLRLPKPPSSSGRL
ncbi:60S ribosomal protein L29-like [Leopardus geoffroyi]|uniref:60S ribosomal protein L29-like n=1 Tax=Leopardus geoffroyi TaxID=46844 RepID=UPI001E2623B2|nr:60S ribosomal protein L29-like [Leopardus geoffroyi]